jgi:hypothetical protein
MTLLGTLSQRTRYATDPVRNRNFIGLSLTYGFRRVGMSAPVGGLSR